MKVLIVDDSKLARMALGKLLTTLHPTWTRIDANNADEALAKVRDEEPDIAIFDFNMPGRDGLTLAAEIRAMRPAMPVAVISANLQHEVVDRAQALGAAFLAKPLAERAFNEFLIAAERKLMAGGN